MACGSDLIASIPEPHTETLCTGLHSFPLPVLTPDFLISLLWHPRQDGDDLIGESAFIDLRQLNLCPIAIASALQQDPGGISCDMEAPKQGQLHHVEDQRENQCRHKDARHDQHGNGLHQDARDGKAADQGQVDHRGDQEPFARS